MKTAGLIAAAGTSSRMGFCKALLTFNDTTFVEHLVKTFIAASISPVIVTLPKDLHGQEIKKVLTRQSWINCPVVMPAQAGIQDLSTRTGFHTKYGMTNQNPHPVLPIQNQFPELSLIGSIRSCLLKLPKDVEQLIIAPIDCPFVTQELLVALTHSASSKPVIIPTFQCHRGHPIMVSRCLFKELDTDKTDLGMKHFLQSHPHLVYELPWHDEAILQNINTPEDYDLLNHLLLCQVNSTLGIKMGVP